MRHREGIRKITWVGACLAFASSMLVLTEPASAAAHEADPVHQDGFRHFAVYLSGDELSDGGDRGGWGMARIDVDAHHETACYVLDWDRLEGKVTAFHLHHAPRHEDGGHWIDFFNDEHFNGRHESASGCVHSPRDKILEVLNDPSDFYFNVHTTAHKAGAIRGQLF